MGKKRMGEPQVRPAGPKSKELGVITRFAYLGLQAAPEKKWTYTLIFRAHRSDFPTNEEAYLYLEVRTDGPPEAWDPDWWPVHMLKAFQYFRHVPVKDIIGTPLAGLPGGEKL